MARSSRIQPVFGPWYMKAMAALAVVAALGLGQPWKWLTGGIALAEDVKDLKKLQNKANDIHMEQNVLNAAQETKIDMLATILLNQGRNGHGATTVSRVDHDAMQRQLVTLASRISNLNTNNAKLKLHNASLADRLDACEEAIR